MTTQADRVEEPSEGGSYVRQPDGRLVRQAHTAAALMRDKTARSSAPEQPVSEASVNLGAAAVAAPGDVASPAQE